MINEVRINGLKGLDTVQGLSGRDIICGKNGSGKSTRAQAIQTAILGYVPGNGKTAADTFKLVNGDTMTVGLTTSGGFRFDRSLEKKTKTKKNGAAEIKIEQELTVSPGKGEKTTADKEKRISEEIGDFPCMLDFDEFLSLSDLKRREFIYGLSTADVALTKDSIAAALKERLLTDDLQENNGEMYQVMAETIDECLGEYADCEDVQTGLQAMHDYAKAQLSYWKKELDKAAGASQKIAEYKNELQETDRNLENNQQTLDQLQKDLTDTSMALATARERNVAFEDATRKINQLKAEMAAIQEQKPGRTPEEINHDIESYQADLVEATDNSAQINKLNSLLLEGRTFIDQQGEERNKWWMTAGTLKTEIVRMEEQIKSIGKQGGVCVINQHIRCTKDFSMFVNHLKDEIAQARQEMEEAKAKQSKAEELIEKAKAKAKAREQKITSLHDAENAALRKNAEIEKIIGELKEELSVAANFDALQAEKVKARNDEIERITAGLPEEKPQELAPLEDAVESINLQISELKDKISEQNKTRTTLMNLKSTLIDSQEAEYRKGCWKQVAESVGPGGLQGDIVKNLIDPIRAEVQKKLDDMGLSDREFFFETASDRGKEVFRFGWFNGDGQRVYFDALSTGEQMLLLIAFMTTIIERKKPALKMLVIDNLNHLDAANIRRVVAGLETAGKGLDNIILLGVIDIAPKDAPAWHVWNLDESVKREVA